jgi:DNA-binding response OmpR family regulator
MTTQPKRLLFIEDNEADLDWVRLHLEKDREVFNICRADRLSTGLTALSKETPDIVLLDLYLPDSRGAETFRAILDVATGVPVVIFTGCDDEMLAVEAAQRGVQYYLVKGTFDGTRLAQTLKCAIEQKSPMTALDMKTKGATAQ